MCFSLKNCDSVFSMHLKAYCRLVNEPEIFQIENKIITFPYPL